VKAEGLSQVEKRSCDLVSVRSSDMDNRKERGKRWLPNGENLLGPEQWKRARGEKSDECIGRGFDDDGKRT